MLTNLSIRNVVLIEKLDIDFTKGLTVMTGETGAGKSILLDSVGLALGARGESSLIRKNCNKLSVTATFNLSSTNPVFYILDEYEIECENKGEITIRRIIDINGKNKLFINDQTTTVKLLKEISKYLVEIHGQFDTHGLLNQANHITTLDSYANCKKELDACSDKFNLLKIASKKRKDEQQKIEKAKQEEDYLRFCIDELKKINPIEDEEEELNKDRKVLMNAEKIIENLTKAHSSINIENNIRTALASLDAVNNLTDGKYNDIIESLDRALIEIQDSSNEIENLANNTEYNTNRLEEIEQRLFSLKNIARKHQCEINDLPNKLQDFQDRLSSIEQGDEYLIELAKKEEQAKLDYIKSAKTLSDKRIVSAKKLDENVIKELPPLKLEKAKFLTQIEKLEENEWSETGFDKISFMIKTNPDSPFGPIGKIASGGELARFMLALKVNLANTSSVPTLIFDELDTGVGGATATAVGIRLKQLAQNLQVLVVTHSPQVASNGDNHMRVEKNTNNDNITTTTLTKLSNNDIKEEIARMLAGETITDEARAAANVLLNKSA